MFPSRSGPPNPIIITGYRLLPFVYDRIIGALFRLAALTRDAEPPNEGNVHAAVPDADTMHGYWPRHQDSAS